MRFLDTTGKSSLAIGICGRCSKKFALVELEPDPNYPGLMVCPADKDLYDPYRLSPRETEDITLTHPRPDERITTTTVSPGDPSWPVQG